MLSFLHLSILFTSQLSLSLNIIYSKRISVIWVIFLGWGTHTICNKKYHFVLPSKETMVAASSSSNSKSMLSLRLMELEGHILHGVFHSNGFGHLLCLNGLEMGNSLPGYLLMDFWDRLCNALKARLASYILNYYFIILSTGMTKNENRRHLKDNLGEHKIFI